MVKLFITAMAKSNYTEANSYLGFDSKVEELEDGSKSAIGPSIKAERFKSFQVTAITEASDSI